MNLLFGSSSFSTPILITLISEEEGSEELLMEVEYEFAKITEDLDAIVNTESMKRFG